MSTKKEKTLVLFRGLPGAGKTDLATNLIGSMMHLANPNLGPGYRKVAHYATDYFFENLGYFDASKLKEAHEGCRLETESSMTRGIDWIFVHNTFTQAWEMKPYFELAEQYGYKVHVVTVENWNSTENIHDVPFPKIEKMAARFEHKLYDRDMKPELSDILKKLYDVPQSEEHHPEGNVGVHTELVLGQLIHNHPFKVYLHWVAVFHDIGKLHTTRWREDKEKYVAYGHELVSEDYVWSYKDYVIKCYESWISRETIVADIAWLVKNHMRVKYIDTMREHKQEQLKSHYLFDTLVEFSKHDNMKKLFEETTEEDRKMYRDLATEFLTKHGLL